MTDNLLAQVSQFNYDDLNRLKDASIAGVYAQAWDYNSIGNMLVFTDTGVAKSYAYNDTAHKHAVTKHNGATQFVYDQNGNMIQRYSDLMQYDVENRLTSTTIGSTTTTNYYNGDGARVKKIVNTGGAAVTTHYIGGIYEYTTWTGGTSIAKYYYFGGQRVAVKNSSGVSYIHGDHLGSTSATSGAVTSTQTFYPFGSIFSSSGTPPTDYGFTGQKRDASANLMYYGARYYDPGLGRFTQPDTIVPNPMDPQSLNRYSYVRNNPVNRVDPTGHEDCAAEDDWCWQDRWYTAHGYCWSDRADDWSNSCQPAFQDPDILAEVLGEKGGIGIVQRANPFDVLRLLLQGVIQQTLSIPLPNMLILGVTVSGNALTGYAGISGQWVFDFKHNQIAFFDSPAWGTGIAGFGFSVGAQFGIGWCNINCNTVDAYSENFAGGGGSFLAPVAGFGVGGGIDYQVSLTPYETHPDIIQVLTFDLLLGTPGGEVHFPVRSYSIPIPGMKYSFGNNDTAMYIQTMNIVYMYTHDLAIANLYGSYAFTVDYQTPQ